MDKERTSSKIPFDDILHRVEHADDIEINKILHTIIKRYQTVFPEEEVVFVSMPKHGAEKRRRIMEAVFAHMDQENESFK